MILMSMVGSEVWEGNKSQAAALESVLLVGGKRILGCSSKTCNEGIWVLIHYRAVGIMLS